MALLDGRPKVDMANLGKVKLTYKQMRGLKKWYNLPTGERGRNKGNFCPFIWQDIPKRCEICMSVFHNLKETGTAGTFRRKCPCVFYRPKYVADIVKEYLIIKGELIETSFDVYVGRWTYYWERFKYIYLPIGIVIALIVLIIFLTRCEQCC